MRESRNDYDGNGKGYGNRMSNFQMSPDGPVNYDNQDVIVRHPTIN